MFIQTLITAKGRFDLGGGGKVRFMLLRHLRILLFTAGEPQKLDRQKYIHVSMKLSFHKLYKIQLSDNLEVLVNSYHD